MWKFEELRVIYYYGFPDGDYAVYREYKNGKPTGREVTPLAYRHYTDGSNTMRALGIDSRAEYLKAKGKLRAYITYEPDMDMTYISVQKYGTRLKDGEYVDAEYPGNLLVGTDPDDWDGQFAQSLGTPI